MKFKNLAAFQRKETVNERGRYEIPELANSKQGIHERRWCSETKREIERSFREKGVIRLDRIACNEAKVSSMGFGTTVSRAHVLRRFSRPCAQSHDATAPRLITRSLETTLWRTTRRPSPKCPSSPSPTKKRKTNPKRPTATTTPRITSPRSHRPAPQVAGPGWVTRPVWRAPLRSTYNSMILPTSTYETTLKLGN